MSRRVVLQRRWLVFVAALLLAIAPELGCNSVLGLDDLKDRTLATDGGADADQRAGSTPDGPVNPDAVGATTATKIDLLLVVDDSSAMADKQRIFADALPAFLNRLADATEDIHVGVIGTSLGGMGGDVCSNVGAQNGRARLRKSGPPLPSTSLATSGFIAFGSASRREINIADVVSVVLAVGEKGCGLEAQLESAYRFLVQPDPWDLVEVAGGRAEYQGIDREVLDGRKAFLRPDSLVVVLMLTDEDDSTVDPRSLGGTGWGFVANEYPGSKTKRADGKTSTAPRPTTECASTPGSPDCRSCAFGATCDVADPACAKVKRDPSCQGAYGYDYGPHEDQLNVRFHRMKQRYGVDPQFPIARYVDGFTKERVPNRDEEHVRTEKDGTVFIEEYGHAPTCTNPLFAAALPAGSGNDLCHLPRGPRGKELVMFGVIGGIPDTLVKPLDWTKVLGADPATFDASGQDPHMYQSTSPRPDLGPVSSTRGDNGTDPVHGREWETDGNDLQYACTFVLGVSRTCSSSEASCDCATALVPPLCGANSGEQVAAKAYPSIRPLRVVRDLGARGLVGSVCPYGQVGVNRTLRPTMSTLAAAITPRIAK